MDIDICLDFVLIVFRYLIFAIISTVVNLLAQYSSFLFYDGFLALYFAMFFGTLAGLIVKYILDKKFIFFYETKDTKDNAKKFFMYSFMGIFTTALFFMFEIGFDYFIDSSNAKYIGAIVGLSIGYLVKYNLDKKYVFKE